MKKSWSKFFSLAQKQVEKTTAKSHPRFWNHVESVYHRMFLMHHQHADSIVMSHDNRPLEAVYKCGDLSDYKPSKLEAEFLSQEVNKNG